MLVDFLAAIPQTRSLVMIHPPARVPGALCKRSAGSRAISLAPLKNTSNACGSHRRATRVTPVGRWNSSPNREASVPLVIRSSLKRWCASWQKAARIHGERGGCICEPRRHRRAVACPQTLVATIAAAHRPPRPGRKAGTRRGVGHRFAVRPRSVDQARGSDPAIDELVGGGTH